MPLSQNVKLNLKNRNAKHMGNSKIEHEISREINKTSMQGYSLDFPQLSL